MNFDITFCRKCHREEKKICPHCSAQPVPSQSDEETASEGVRRMVKENPDIANQSDYGTPSRTDEAAAIEWCKQHYTTEAEAAGPYRGYLAGRASLRGEIADDLGKTSIYKKERQAALRFLNTNDWATFEWSEKAIKSFIKGMLTARKEQAEKIGFLEQDKRMLGVLKEELAAHLADTAQTIIALEKERDELKEALREFDDDDNWLLESSYIDRPSKTGGGDRIYIGKWDPRVFSAHAILGTPLPNTPLEERGQASAFYNPGQAVPNHVHDKVKAERDEALARMEKMKFALQTIATAEPWTGMRDENKYAGIDAGYIDVAKQALLEKGKP